VKSTKIQLRFALRNNNANYKTGYLFVPRVPPFRGAVGEPGGLDAPRDSVWRSLHRALSCNRPLRSRQDLQRRSALVGEEQESSFLYSGAVCGADRQGRGEKAAVCALVGIDGQVPGGGRCGLTPTICTRPPPARGHPRALREIELVTSDRKLKASGEGPQSGSKSPVFNPLDLDWRSPQSSSTT